jgi:hypothetical protein
MHMAKSLKNIYKKSYHIFIQLFFKKEYVLACILGFNNQIIKVMRTRPIFQKYQKNYFLFF